MIARPQIYRTDLSFEQALRSSGSIHRTRKPCVWVCMAGAVSQSNSGACAKGGGQ